MIIQSIINGVYSFEKWSQFYENIAIRGPFIDKLQSVLIYYDNEGHYFTLHENYNPKYKSDNIFIILKTT